MLAKKKISQQSIKKKKQQTATTMPCPNGRVNVKGYVRKGRTVKGHTRKCPAKQGKKANYSKYLNRKKKKPANTNYVV